MDDFKELPGLAAEEIEELSELSEFTQIESSKLPILFHHFNKKSQEPGRAKRGFDIKRREVLQEFLRRILEIVVGDNRELMRSLLNANSLDEWEKVFTHVSVSKNNYEFYEIVGDAMMKSVFISYVSDIADTEQDKQELKQPSTMNLLVSKYLSTEFQSELSREHLLDKMVMVSQDVQIDARKMAEDVLEAFFGALARLVDTVPGYRGQGYIYCFNLFAYIFRRYRDTIDPGIQKDPKTQLKERFDILVTFLDIKRPYEVTEVLTTPSGQKIILMKLFFDGKAKREMWAQVRGPEDDKITLLKELYQRGLVVADQKGFTEEYVAKLRESRDLRNKEFREQIEQFNVIRENMNRQRELEGQGQIVAYSFSNQTIDQENRTVVSFDLVWRMEDGSTVQNTTTIGVGRNRIEAQTDAVQKFNQTHAEFMQRRL